jgi:CheY-like chemotaxis protein
MKKILIEQELNRILQKQNSFLHRNDMRVITAASNDEALEIHRAERANLIITQQNLPGMNGDQFCSLLRNDGALRDVAIIMVCPNNKRSSEQSLLSGANAVYRRPIKPTLVLAKAKKLLNISWRETYRVLLSVSVEGNACDHSFSCRTLDISTTGMLMETALTFRQGDVVVCSFFLPDADTTHIQATGVIVRTIQQAPGSEANRYGIHFLDLAPAAQRAVDAFLASSSSGSSQGISGSAQHSRGARSGLDLEGAV